MPEVGKIQDIREPIVKVTLFMPQDYVGPVMTLCNNKRGSQVNMSYHGRQVHLVYEIPLAEIVLDFFDKLKSVSRGYASLDYHFVRFEAGPFVRVEPCRSPWPRAVREDEGPDPAPDVRRGHPGRGRLADHRPYHGQGHAQERAGQVLWWRRFAQEEASGKAEGRQEAHEAGG
ncbi:hypothetical protein G6F50_015987 [Rhizopus delemar]|uniref:Elongation factor EFG domain-containing protein n=1 Tax=Rhizopus delemar TaxID=936053 RepID=A0A9P6XUY0_9FUNG|nr:hypothetical protein G6F50_015987 [Rhizopus delemar]